MSEPPTLANIDGRILPLEQATVPALDRGFLFGDAVYEVLRTIDGRPWLVEDHFERLARSLESMRITGVDLARLRRRVMDTIAAGPFTDAVVYIQVTRGSAPMRAHTFPESPTPLEFFFVKAYTDTSGPAREKGVKVVLHPDLRWQRCDIKSVNLLGNVLARQAAKEADAVEALLLRADGTITEGSATSLFGVEDGALVTAPSGPWILPGVTRRFVLRLAGQVGLPVHERFLHRDELPSLPELFLTGTTSQVLPIVQVEDQTIGSGAPGPVTRRLQAAFDEAIRQFRAGA